jgi:DNA-binding NarL/FixJ family response regulator
MEQQNFDMSFLNDADQVEPHKAPLTEGNFMSPAPLRVLVAENQYLIAMEVGRLLDEAFPCEVTITPLAHLRETLAREKFDVVIVEAVLAEPENIERTRAILESGARPVFLSSYDHLAIRGTVLSAHPVVAKPPQSEELAAAVLGAAHRR